MSTHLANLGLTGEFFPAVDGRALADSAVEAVYDEAAAKKTEWGALTRGEIGCALSHRKVWQALLASGESGWLVLKDDAVLAEDVPHWLGMLADLIRDGDVVPFVPTDRNPYLFRQQRLQAGRRLIYANQACIAATVYYVTPLAADRLLSASMPIWFPIDCWYSKPGFLGVTPIRAVWPAAALPRGEAQAPSTIGFRAAHAGKAARGKYRHGALRAAFRQLRLWLKNSFFNRPVRFD